MLQEVGVLGEVVVLAVFQTEDAVGQEQLALENEVGQGGDLLQGVGWVGKNEVELLVAGFEKAEHVATNGEGTGEGTGEGIMGTVLLGIMGTVLLCHGQDTARTVPFVLPFVAPSRTVPFVLPFVLQFPDAVLDKAVVVAVELYADYLLTASGQQLERDAACA